MIPILLLTPTMVMATTPYQAGYAHGVNDEKTNVYNTGEGFASHTKEFNQGYIDGYCSLESTSGMPGMDADQATFNCPECSIL